MTVPEYNTGFYPLSQKALNFIGCIDNAIGKCDENTHMQFKVIGWDEETKAFINEAISEYIRATKKGFNS